MIRHWLAALTLSLAPLAVCAQTVLEPDGYREDHYRGPVPETLSGGVVIDEEVAHELWRDGDAGFIDVLPRAPKPANLPEGTIWRERPRMTIPGAIWLPNVGYGRLAPQTEAYLREGLRRATNGDKTRKVVIFCLEECWMSWNAAKRAIAWGYSAVYWFPDGTDGWALWNFPVEEAKPMEGQPQAQ